MYHLLGAILISQWFQPHLSICETDIYNELDDITENVRCVLRKMGYSNLTVPLSIGTQGMYVGREIIYIGTQGMYVVREIIYIGTLVCMS